MQYKFDEFVLDPERYILSKSGTPTKLEPQVYALLELLIVHSGKVVTKDEIIKTVWNGRHVSDATINSRIHAARAAINDDGTKQRLIKTIPNVGLRFVGKIRIEKHGPQQVEAPRQTEKPRESQSSFWRARPVLFLLVPAALAGLLALGAMSRESYPASEFIYTADAAIFGHNTTRIWGLTAQECMKACLAERNFYCKSIDYTRVEKMCDLSDKSAEDVGGLKTDYPGRPHDHYERKLIDLDKAKDIQMEAKDRAEHHLDITLKLAASLLRDGKPQSINLAAEYYMAAITQEPNSTEALAGLAEARRLQYLNGSIEKADILPSLRLFVESAASLSSDNPDVQTAAAAVALLENDYARAIDFADQAIGHRHLHGARVHHYKSLALLKLGKKTEAVEEHKEVIFHDPDFPFTSTESEALVK